MRLLDSAPQSLCRRLVKPLSVMLCLLLTAVPGTAFQAPGSAQPSDPLGAQHGPPDVQPEDGLSASPTAAPQTNGQVPIEPPLTPGGKFRLFASKSFLSPTPYAWSMGSGTLAEALDDEPQPNRTAGDFVVNSLNRAGRSFAFRGTANFFEKVAYASILRQDPRYYRSEKKGTGSRIKYAITRLFVTRSDQGTSQFNASYLLGGLTAAGISNVWEREAKRTVGGTMKRWAFHLSYTALTNLVREFKGKR